MTWSYALLSLISVTAERTAASALVVRPDFGLLIRLARNAKGLTQDDLAVQVGNSILDETHLPSQISKHTISGWERGKHVPDLQHQRHLAKVLGTTREELGFVIDPRSAEAVAVAVPSEAPSAGVDTSAEWTSVNELAEEPPSGSGSPHLVGLDQPEALREHSRLWKPTALVAGLAACALVALALAQAGPFGKQIVILEGVPSRPAAVTPKGHPQTAVRAPDCQGNLRKHATSPRNGMAIEIDIAITTPACWTQRLSPINPGTTLRYLIAYLNTSKYVEDNVVISANLAPGVDLVPNTTKVINGNYPHGIADYSNNVGTGGLNIGNYGPGGGAYVEFDAALPLAGGEGCGWNEFRTIGVGQVNATNKTLRGNQYYNRAYADVYKNC